jgi:REP element-mobilizing transposase RayT
MNNHIHLLWQMKTGHPSKDVQLSFMPYTAQQIQRELKKSNPVLLEQFKVNKVDRKYPRLNGTGRSFGKGRH